jgi:hypothetical protein
MYDPNSSEKPGFIVAEVDKEFPRLTLVTHMPPIYTPCMPTWDELMAYCKSMYL